MSEKLNVREDLQKRHHENSRLMIEIVDAFAPKNVMDEYKEKHALVQRVACIPGLKRTEEDQEAVLEALPKLLEVREKYIPEYAEEQYSELQFKNFRIEDRMHEYTDVQLEWLENGGRERCPKYKPAVYNKNIGFVCNQVDNVDKLCTEKDCPDYEKDYTSIDGGIYKCWATERFDNPQEMEIIGG